MVCQQRRRRLNLFYLSCVSALHVGTNGRLSVLLEFLSSHCTLTYFKEVLNVP